MSSRILPKSKHVALIAHDNCKNQLLDWVSLHKKILSKHHLYATGTTGHLIIDKVGLPVQCMISGPLGGDQQIGALIASSEIDILIFLWDPLNNVPHDPDVKALLRLATVWNIPIATNLTTAEFIISSPYFNQENKIFILDYQSYLNDRKT